MKHDLTCAVVRDLLPSFVEGLTSEETNALMAAHLADCPACAKLHRDMTAPEEAAETAVPEVDYLKKVKKKSWKRVVLAVLCTVLLIATGFAAKIFVIGTPAQAQELVVVDSAEEDGVLRLSFGTPCSATAYHSWKVEQSDAGVVHIRARSVLVSPLFRHGGGTVEVPLEGVDSIYLCGKLVWQDGMMIPESLWRLYETRTPYVGDAPALGRITAALNIQELLGGYTTELQTSQPPYGWTLKFQNQVGDLTEVLLPYLGPQMLALVDNLEEVSWTCPSTYRHTSTRTLTVDAVNEHLPEWVEAYNDDHGTQWTAKDSVKDYAASAGEFQQLFSILQYRYETRRLGVDDMDLLQ